jgi:hypothetical protein
MVNLKRWVGIALLGAGVVPCSSLAQPALTTIQDTLYLADGTRFSGTMYITYSSFLAGDTSDIATANLTLPIVNGALNVQLAPTTTASAGAQYNVMYNSNGVNQFTQVWAVPPSSVTLRVRDVLVSTGTVVGPQPVTSPIQISDVMGLENTLSLTAMKGVGFVLGRAAVINSSGQIDGAAGNLSDCVRVDGSSGPCGSSGGGVLPSFSDGEVPGGSINGTNTSFTLANQPSPAASLELYLNGLRLDPGTDFVLMGQAVTFLTASTPQPGDLLLASYRYANPSNPLGSLASPQVVCSRWGRARPKPCRSAWERAPSQRDCWEPETGMKRVTKTATQDRRPALPARFTLVERQSCRGPRQLQRRFSWAARSSEPTPAPKFGTRRVGEAHRWPFKQRRDPPASISPKL